MIKSTLLGLVVYACLRASSARRNAPQWGGIVDALKGRYLDRHFTRFKLNGKGMNKWIDDCGGDKKVDCIREKLERKFPDKEWDVWFTDNEKERDLLLPAFMNHWTRVLFPAVTGHSCLFIMADPKGIPISDSDEDEESDSE